MTWKEYYNKASVECDRAIPPNIKDFGKAKAIRRRCLKKKVDWWRQNMGGAGMRENFTIFDFVREHLLYEQEELDESLKGLARRIKKKIKDPRRKKAYERAWKIKDRERAMVYHARRAKRGGFADPNIDKTIAKHKKRERWASRLHAKAFDPKQFKGRKKMWMER